MNGVFIVGCGGLGREVAALWLEKGQRVAALVRQPHPPGFFTLSGTTFRSQCLPRAGRKRLTPSREAHVRDLFSH